MMSPAATGFVSTVEQTKELRTNKTVENGGVNNEVDEDCGAAGRSVKDKQALRIILRVSFVTASLRQGAQ